MPITVGQLARYAAAHPVSDDELRALIEEAHALAWQHMQPAIKRLRFQMWRQQEQVARQIAELLADVLPPIERED